MRKASNPQDGAAQFEQEVFPAELEEIKRRRRKLNLKDVPPGPGPAVRLGLVGLALSGGGIRSSTFCLGVIQALTKRGLLKTVDYLSTVSGGGFIGSCISSLLNSKGAGPDQERFPLRFQVGEAEPLAVSQLRDSSRYLAPGGFLDKLRIPALALRGVVSNLMIFLLLILLLVLATEVVYEVGQRALLPFHLIILAGIIGFVLLVLGFPAVHRLLRPRSTWRARNLGEIAFTVALLILLFTVFLVPLFILVDQAIDRSWSEVKESVTANLLRPFEARDLTQWAVILALLVAFMLAGRASAQVSQVAGKIGLVILGLLGPLMLGFFYLGLVVLEIDSPYITPDELFNLETERTEDLDDRVISPELKSRFAENQIRLSDDAEIINLEEDVRWVLRDGELAYTLVRERNDLSVYPDFQDALSRGRVPPELIASLQRKGYPVDPMTVAKPVMQDNHFKIEGSHRYWIDPGSAGGGGLSLEQIVTPTAILETLQDASYDLPFADAASGILVHEGVSLSDDDIELAVRFVEEGNPHDVVLVIDNSTPRFSDPDAFREAFALALTDAIMGLRATVRLAVFLFEADVHRIAGFAPMTKENKRALTKSLFEETDGARRLDFQGQLSNAPAALARAFYELTEGGRRRVKRSIVFVSDGVVELAGQGQDQAPGESIMHGASFAATRGIRIYGIALSEQANFKLFHGLTTATGGNYFPVFESSGVGIYEDLKGVVSKVKESAGGRLTTQLKQVSISDQDSGTRYELTRAERGIRIRATVADGPLTSDGLAELSDRWREILADNGIELSAQATARVLADGRWEVSDPYAYVISRSGKKLKVLPHDTAETSGAFALGRLIPPSIWDDSTDWFFVVLFAILLIYWLTVDVNATAVHSFYRDRLSKAYLMRTTGTGAPEHNDKQKLSRLNEQDNAPYHLINGALNLSGSRDPSLRGRQSDFFIFSKLFTGSLRTQFLPTEQMERYDSGLDLGTAMAVSGAAAAPNRGVTTVKPLVFIMTLLNIRLGYWLPNPRVVRSASWLDRLALRRGPGPKYLLRESLGRVTGRANFINVSDGGHIENLAIYQLLRRRCRLIVAVDGERDPELRFRGLVKLMLYARIEMGIEIEIDLDPIRKDAQGMSSQHFALGKIDYGDGETGHLLYVKASLTGDEYEYVREYASRNPGFPHESTADQFFDENRFEAYRALGYHIGEQLFVDPRVTDELKHVNC